MSQPSDDFGFVSFSDLEKDSDEFGFVPFESKKSNTEDEGFLNNLSNYAKTALKGTIEGIGSLGRMMGPLQDNEQGRSTEDQLNEQTENLDFLLPTDEGYSQKGLRRGLKQAPTMLSFPGSALQTIPRTIAAGFLGEGAKELGLPEWAQSAAELTAYIGPDVTKKLIESGKNKDIIKFAKKMGMTDEQITPLIQSEFKQKWLSKLSGKRGTTQKALRNTKEGLDQAYHKLQQSENAGKSIGETNKDILFGEFIEAFKEMPRELRDKIFPDLQDLLNDTITGKSLINFYKDINFHLSGKTKQLAKLKEPIKKAINSISPDLGNDFEMVNKLYTKYYPISSKLKPNLVSDLVSAGEAIGLLGSLVTGNYPAVGVVVSQKAAKTLAEQMLINPRLQQISKKTVEAMNQNKWSVVVKLIQALSKQIEKESPQAAKELNKISEEDLRENFSQET